MAEAAAKQAAPTGRHQRRLKNYLLDRKFQLKYAGYFVGISALLSVVLGMILWMTSQKLLAQSAQLVERGQAVVAEGKKVSEVVKMNIVKDPVYGEDKELLTAFEEGDQEYTKKLEQEQTVLAQESSALRGQHQMAALVLSLSLVVFVVFVGLMGILVTHKVAGPIFKMKRQLNQVADGHLRIPDKLRKGDELVEFFDAFHRMVVGLRERQQAEIQLLEECIAKLEDQTAEADLAPLRSLLTEMKGALDT
jgi:methyl-accepting chemotaxis protein